MCPQPLLGQFVAVFVGLTEGVSAKTCLKAIFHNVLKLSLIFYHTVSYTCDKEKPSQHHFADRGKQAMTVVKIEMCDR